MKIKKIHQLTGVSLLALGLAVVPLATSVKAQDAYTIAQSSGSGTTGTTDPGVNSSTDPTVPGSTGTTDPSGINSTTDPTVPGSTGTTDPSGINSTTDPTVPGSTGTTDPSGINSTTDPAAPGTTGTNSTVDPDGQTTTQQSESASDYAVEDNDLDWGWLGLVGLLGLLGLRRPNRNVADERYREPETSTRTYR